LFLSFNLLSRSALRLDHVWAWLAIKLLEQDEEAEKIVYDLSPHIKGLVEESVREIQRLHGESSTRVMASERYTIANQIANQGMTIVAHPSLGLTDRLDELLTSRIWGYPIMAIAMLTVFYGVFTYGDVTSEILASLFEELKIAFLGITGQTYSSNFSGKASWRG